MATIKLLYQLQEIELEIESDEHSLQQIVSQLGQNQAVVRVQNKLLDAQSRLEELKRQQNSAEWEIDDITTKLKATEEQLYGCLLYTSPSPRDQRGSRMPSSA